MIEVEMTKGVLQRKEQDDKQTLGELTISYQGVDVWVGPVLELPWKDNEKNVSCIPAGEYKVVPYSSEKYPFTYEVLDVPGRSKILIHAGNYNTDTKGCLLVGTTVKDINRDGVMDVSHSMKALRSIKTLTDYKPFTLTILDPTS